MKGEGSSSPLIKTPTELWMEMRLLKSAKNNISKVLKLKEYVENIEYFVKPLSDRLVVYNNKLVLAIKTLLKRDGIQLYNKAEKAIYSDRITISKFVSWEYWLIDATLIRIGYQGSEAILTFPIWYDVNRIISRASKYLSNIDEAKDNINIYNKTIYLTKEHETLIKDIEFWINKRNWFYSKGLLYKRTYLLTGPPGTGKSTFIKQVASAIDMNVVTIDPISQFYETQKRYKYVKENFEDEGDLQRAEAPLQKSFNNSLLLIEDLDRLDFSKIRLDKMLNFLDGTQSSEGVIIFITCNDPEKLPDALKRPGRVDKIVEFSKFDDQGLLHIANNIFEARGEEILTAYKNVKWEKDIDIINVNTPAHFVQFCTQRAVSEFELQTK